jgi:hypothetical protein
MALIRNFTRTERNRYSVHDEIEATYSTFERDGRMFFQLDSYGRKDRQVPGKQSQTIQLDRQGGLALYKLLGQTFHFE